MHFLLGTEVEVVQLNIILNVYTYVHTWKQTYNRAKQKRSILFKKKTSLVYFNSTADDNMSQKDII